MERWHQVPQITPLSNRRVPSMSLELSGTQKSAISPCCSKFIQDLLSRVHTAESHKHAQECEAYAKAWMENRPDHYELYKGSPTSVGIEQNVKCLDDAFLERVERYWVDNELCSPIQQEAQHEKAKHCAHIGDWQEAQRRALEEE